MKTNSEKYDLLINNTKETVSNSKYGKLLWVKVDYELNLNEHASALCKKANQKHLA